MNNIGIDRDRMMKNLELYMYMKRIYGNAFKLKDPEKKFLIAECENFINEKSDYKLTYNNIVRYCSKNLSTKTIQDEYTRLLKKWNDEDNIYILYTALRLVEARDEIKELTKKSVSKIIDKIVTEDNIHPLSLKYDSIKCEEIYTRRAILYNCTLSYINTKIKSDVCLYKSINNIKDKVNIIPIYLDILIESSRQGGFTYAGSKYEDLIYEHLHNIGITEEDNELLRFEHEENAETLEHDFTFVYKNIKFGISAKKTLRERYKQYVNLLGNTDTQIPLCICLGTDLNKDKAERMTNLGVNVFVSPEIYNERKFLQEMDKIYNIENFDTNILDLIIHKYKITSNYNIIKTVLGSVEDIESESDECEYFLLEEEENEYKIELESKYVYIPTLGIKIHYGYCNTYNNDTNEYELDHDINIVFDINTNEQVYEEPQSDLIGCISNYINLRNKPVDDILGLECQVIY